MLSFSLPTSVIGSQVVSSFCCHKSHWQRALRPRTVSNLFSLCVPCAWYRFWWRSRSIAARTSVFKCVLHHSLGYGAKLPFLKFGRQGPGSGRWDVLIAETASASPCCPFHPVYFASVGSYTPILNKTQPKFRGFVYTYVDIQGNSSKLGRWDFYWWTEKIKENRKEKKKTHATMILYLSPWHSTSALS